MFHARCFPARAMQRRVAQASSASRSANHSFHQRDYHKLPSTMQPIYN
jgi:hypothetical protein